MSPERSPVASESNGGGRPRRPERAQSRQMNEARLAPIVTRGLPHTGHVGGRPCLQRRYRSRMVVIRSFRPCRRPGGSPKNCEFNEGWKAPVVRTIWDSRSRRNGGRNPPSGPLNYPRLPEPLVVCSTGRRWNGTARERPRQSVRLFRPRRNISLRLNETVEHGSRDHRRYHCDLAIATDSEQVR